MIIDEVIAVGSDGSGKKMEKRIEMSEIKRLIKVVMKTVLTMRPQMGVVDLLSYMGH